MELLKAGDEGDDNDGNGVGGGKIEVLEPMIRAVVPLLVCSATVVGEPPLLPGMVIGYPAASV